jgi:predicted amidohydrolase YtcJ
MLRAFRIALACTCLAFTATSAHSAPDKIYVNGRVWTGADDALWAEAIAVEGERIVAVGSSAQIGKLATADTRRLDLHGAFVAPGFIDNHVHFIESGLGLDHVDLRKANTPERFNALIGEAAARKKPGEWVLSGGWDHELWGGELPSRDWIDARTRNTAVFVTRLDGHMALANSKALSLAGIDERTADPPGGTIVRDENGRPTGVLKDRAQDLVAAHIPAESEEQLDRALQKATDQALRVGLTQVHDMGMYTWRSLETYRRAQAANTLRIRVYSFVPLKDWKRMADYVAKHGRGSDWLRWGALKGYVDGSLGSTTAWFYKPYLDEPQTSGLIMVDPEVQRGYVRDADRAGLHIAVHAIGDRANDWLLDTYRQVAAENGPRDRRWRVEHAQHLAPSAIARFAQQGVIPSMQPYHAIDDGRWAHKRIGDERLKGTYAFRSLLDANAPLTFGSDWSVAPLDPLLGIYAAVTRRTIDGANPNGWLPEQKITVEQALRAYTRANAYAGFQEKSLGQIRPGYLADFVVLSDDLMRIAPEKIADVKVLRTVIAGRDAFVRSE